MDWDLVIERNGKALRRIVAGIAAVPEAGLRTSLRGQFTFFPVSGRFAKGEEQGPVDLA